MEGEKKDYSHVEAIRADVGEAEAEAEAEAGCLSCERRRHPLERLLGTGG